MAVDPIKLPEKVAAYLEQLRQDAARAQQVYNSAVTAALLSAGVDISRDTTVSIAPDGTVVLGEAQKEAKPA